MLEKLSLIAMKSKLDRRTKFTSLAHLVNNEMLLGCYLELKRNKAVGVDGVTVEEFGTNLNGNVSKLVDEMKSKSWRPQPVRRVYIPKPGKSEKRPLGIPSTQDKLVQMAVKKILENIFESEFLDCSHGFRPNRSCHTAIKRLNECMMNRPVNFVVEVDIRRFFDNVSHYWLQRCLEEKISDPNLVWIVRKLLKAGVMTDGGWEPSSVGTPQGAIVSPILSNIYLHYVLDLWFEKVFKGSSRNFMQLIRYADDFIVAFESRQDAERFTQALRGRFSKFGIEVAEEKTRLIEMGRRKWKLWKQGNGERCGTFNFLGFTHYAATSRAGYFMAGHKTSKENLRRKLREMKDWLKSVRSVASFSDWRPTLHAKLIGHYNYFGVSNNMRCLRQYYVKTVSLLFKWLNRRSQKKSFSWLQYMEHLQRFPLPQPQIKVRLFELRTA
ncbi:MAG: group II intron reverse transcriptase/maturase [Deltaproteobacteria bacterium]|nr:group II intron reverse transcriptase/maturase [Deltaproteobacteria bacterium]